jgi:uncharacterized membrane protein
MPQARKERAVMAVTIESRYSSSIHPLHAILLAGTVPLFLGAALSDAEYASTYEIQWNNFASWLIVGGLVFGGVALLFAIADLSRPARRVPGVGVYFAILLATWIVGFLNALMHARDAWGSMPGGLVMSLITAVLACLAAWLGFATPRFRGLR